MNRNEISRYAVIVLAVLAICMTSGCATKDTVSSRFPALQDNINAAKKADAEVYAPAPLKSAEAKLAAAKLAVQAQDMVSANKLVDEAMADADYARAMAPTEKAKSDAMKLRESIQAVREEIYQLPAGK
ncbi:MAG: DUF4398 domain-containing protein [Thermodesulfobacteriota bacterium]